MNKGIRKACGDYCLFLNSGDWLIESETLANVFAEIAGLPNADIYYSDLQYSNKKYFQEDVQQLIYNPISHQNSLIRRSLFLDHELYNENLRIASDWEFWLKEYYIYRSSFSHLRTNICIFDINGIGSIYTPEHSLEDKKIFQNVFHELSESIIELRNYHYNCKELVIENIKHRGGLGLRFIVKCFIAWLFRDRKLKRKSQ
jgi:hypothetical protein